MKDLLDRISNLNVLVIGDIMLDHYIIGDANRLSPEAPVPVVAVDNDKYVLGAAGNVAVNVSELGASVEIVGKIGHDRFGGYAGGLLRKHGILHDSRLCCDGVKTISKTRVVVRGQQLCRVDREDKKQQYLLCEDDIIQSVCEKIKYADAVILSDYAKGSLSNDNVKLFIDTANKHNTFISVDPKPLNKLLFNNASLMTPNKQEAYELVGLSLLDYENVSTNDVCKVIIEKYSPKYLVITMGPDGMLIRDHDGNIKQIPTYAREVFDVSGAGDTSIACLTLALSTGASLMQAATFANIAAGIVVGKHGTATVSIDEMMNCEHMGMFSL